MADRIIRIVLTGDSKGAVRAMATTEAAAGRTQGALSRLHSAGQGISSVGRSMTALAVPLVALGGYAIKTAASFEASMTLLRTQVGASAGEVANMGKAIRGLAPRVGEGPVALAQALYPIESVGLRGAQALNALKAAAMGAQVSGANLGDTADAVAGAMKTQMFDVRSASDAMSIMNGIVAQGKMHLTDLTAAMGTGVLTTAKAAGLGFRDLGGAIAAMTRQGIPAQDEATRMQRTLQMFEAPKGQALKALSAIGLGQFSLADDLRKPHGLITALADLRSHMAGLTKDQQNWVISTAFGGAKGAANVTALLNALPMMRQIQGPLAGANAAQLTGAMSTRSKDASFRFDQLKASTQVALVQLGNAILPLVLTWLPKLTKLISEFTGWFSRLPKSVKEVFLWFTAFLAIGGPVLMFVGKLVTAVSTIGGAMSALVGVFGTAETEIGAETAAVATGMGGLAAAIVPLAAAIAAALVLLKVHKQIEHAGQSAGQAAGKFLLGSPAHPTVLGHVAGLIGTLAGGNNYRNNAYLGSTAFTAMTAQQQQAVMQLMADHSEHRDPFGNIMVGTGARALPLSYFQGVLKGVHLPGWLKVPGLQDGGMLGGYGGGDRILAALEAGEGIITKEATQAIGGQNAINAINATGRMASDAAGMQQLMVTMPIQVRLPGGRILAEETVRFSAKKSALSGRYVSG